MLTHPESVRVTLTREYLKNMMTILRLNVPKDIRREYRQETN